MSDSNLSKTFIIDSRTPSYELGISFSFNDSAGKQDIVTTYSYIGGNAYLTLGGVLQCTGTGLTFETDSAHGGIINVLYYDGSIISGTFSFQAISGDSVVQMTDGEFDLGVQ